MKWTWRIPAEPGRTLELDFNFWSGSKRVTIDGELVPTQSKMTGWSHAFPVGTQQAILRAKVKYLAVPEASLEIDGREITPTEAPRPLPVWTWAFVVANLAILIVSGGGAIPGALGGVGAVSAIGLARSKPSLVARLGLCVLVTAAAWAAYFGLVSALTK
jgi:hypothetical protein